MLDITGDSYFRKTIQFLVDGDTAVAVNNIPFFCISPISGIAHSLAFVLPRNATSNRLGNVLN